MGLLGDVMVRLGLDVADFQKGLRDSEKKMKSIGGKISKVGSGLTKAVALPLAGVGIAAIKVGADFEKGMSKVGALTRATDTEFTQLENKARELGKSTKYSAGEVADAMGFLGMAGFGVNDILASTGDMLNMASISGLDLATTADITSNILSGLGMDAKETGKLVDSMAYTMANSNVDVGMLGESMKYVAPTARDLGVDLGELTASIGMLGDAGIQGGQAGRILANGLTRLASHKGAQKMMDKLGIKAYDANGKLKPLPSVIGELEKGLKDLNPKERAGALKEMFGMENVKGWSVLVAEGSDAMGEFAKEINGAEGAGALLAEQMQNNLYGKLDSLKASLEEVGIKIYKALEEPLKKVIDVIINVVDWFGQFNDSTVAVITILGGLGVLIPVIVLAIGGFITVFGSVIGTVAGLIGPVTAVIAGLVALGAGFTLAWQKSETFRELVSKVFNSVKNLAVEAFQIVKDAVVKNIQKVKDFWDSNGPTIQKAFENVVKAIGKVFDVVFPIVKKVVIDVVKNIMKVIGNLVDFVLGFVKVISGVFAGDWKTAWEGMKQMVSSAVKAVWNVVQASMVGQVLKLFISYGGKIKSALSDVATKMAGPFIKGYNSVIKKVTILKDGVVRKFKSMVSSISSTLVKVTRLISKPFTTAWDKIKGIPGKIVSAFSKIKIKIPKFKLPKISVSAGKKVMGITVPKLSVNWNAKGNIFNGASILGGGQGVGEAGAEAVLPIQHKRYMKPFSSAIASHLKDDFSTNNKGDVTNNFNINSLVVREEADIKKVANELDRLQRKQSRAKGVFAY